MAGDPRGYSQDTSATITISSAHSLGQRHSGANDFITRNTGSRLGMKARNHGTPQREEDVLGYPQLVVSCTPTKLNEQWAQEGGAIELKNRKKGNEQTTPMQQSQLLLSNYSAATSYFPESAEPQKRASKEPPVIHLTKRTTQVSQLLQSTNQPQRIVDAYNNLSRTIEQSNKIDKSASSTSLGTQKMPPVPQTGRGGQVSSNMVAGVYTATSKYASRKPPQYTDTNQRKPKQDSGYSMSSHWQLPINNRVITNRGSDLTANNRLATLKKEQLQRGMLSQMNGSSHNLLDEGVKVSLIAQPADGAAFSPMKIMQDLGEEDRKYLVLNCYPQEPFKDIISTKSQYTDPFLSSNPLLLSASSHRDENIYYRHLDSPIKNQVINMDQSAYANLMIRDGSLDSIQQASSFYPTQTFDASLSNRRSLDEGLSAFKAIDQQAQVIAVKKSFKEGSPALPRGGQLSSMPMKHAIQAATLRSMGCPNKQSSNYKRSIVGGNSSHFRHSSNSVKKALIAQINNGSVIAPVGLAALTQQSPANTQVRNYNSNLNGGSSIEKPIIVSSDQQQFQYRVVPTISYESSTSVLKTEPSIMTAGQAGSPMKIHSKKDGQYGQPIKKFGKFNNMRQSHCQGFEDINKELKTIIEKERALTDEIIKNSLVKQNGRFNFEALAHLNDIIESKKSLKKKFGVEGLSLAPRQGDHCMVIKSYQESQNNEVYDQVLNTNVIPNESLNEYATPNNTYGVLQNRDSGIGKSQRISDIFLKNILTQHKIVIGSPANGLDEPCTESISSPTGEDLKILSVLNSKTLPPQVIQQSPMGGGVSKLKKKKKSPREVKKSTQQPKIRIYHEEDASKKHIQDHPINKAIQKINYLIRLIFKYQNSQKEVAPPSALVPNQNQNNSTNAISQQSQILPTMLQAHQVEEQRLQEIQRVAGKWFGIALPLKKLESRTALREYFQSREFTVTLRAKMNSILHAAINKSNNMVDIVNQVQQQQSAQGVVFQRFYIGWGNNDAIVRSVIKQRHWWQQCNNEDFNECSFMWTQWKKQAHLDFLGGGKHIKDVDQSSILIQSTTASSKLELLLQSESKPQMSPRVNSTDQGIKLYNRMEQNKQLTNKKGVFLNMREYYYVTGKDPFEVLPVTFLIKTGKGTGENDFIRFTLTYSDVAEEIKSNERQRVLEIERRSREIRNELQQKRRDEQAKVAAAEELAMAQRKKVKKGVQNIISTTSAVQLNKQLNRPSQWRQRQVRPLMENEPEETDETDDEEQARRLEEEKALIDSDDQIREIKMKYPVSKNIWIVKPGENTNRGNGINVCSDLNEIRALVLPTQSSTEVDSTFIIQRYIDNPLLIHGRKFDFRCYGVMTSINGCLKGYVYEDAYIRTSCKEFDIEDVHNKFIHLTNDAVQKFSQDYGKYENGNKLSLSDFQKYLKVTYPSFNIDVWRDIMPQIRKLITDSYRSVYGKIDPSRLHNSFELFGYDFMLDENFRLYLIEVNTNPCLEMSCPLLARIIPEVLDNTFRIVLDPIFPAPSGDTQNTRKYQLIPQEIKYTLVFDEETDGPEITKLRENPIPFGQNQAGGLSQHRLSQNNGPLSEVAIGVIDEIESDQEDDMDPAQEMLCRTGGTLSQCGIRKASNQSAGSKKGSNQSGKNS